MLLSGSSLIPVIGLSASTQVDDVVVHICSFLGLDDLLCLRLTNRHLNAISNAKVVWLSVLQRLNLPLPIPLLDVSALPTEDVIRLAIHAARLDTNWRSTRPIARHCQKISLDSAIVAMELVGGVLFTAHKDGVLRCWHGLPSPKADGGIRSHTVTPTNCLKLTPEARIVRYTFLRVCQDLPHDRFVVAFGGDGLDRRTYCGIFYVPLNPPTVSQAPACVGKIFEETLAKGVISLVATPSTLITGRAQGPLSCIDIETGMTYSIDTGAVLPAEDSKILRVSALDDDNVIVLSTDALAIYHIATAQEPHVEHPTFLRALNRCVAGWTQTRERTATPQPPRRTLLLEESRTTLITTLTASGLVIRHDLLHNKREGEDWRLEVAASGAFPVPVDKLSLTELVGGTSRPVWVHWSRGADDWPTHLFASDLGGKDAVGGEAITFTSLGAIGSSPPKLGPAALESCLWDVTRSVSMPRVAFDECTGRMIVAGSTASAMMLCDYV